MHMKKSKHTGSGAAVGCCAGIRYAACLGVGCRYSRTRDRGNRASGAPAEQMPLDVTVPDETVPVEDVTLPAETAVPDATAEASDSTVPEAPTELPTEALPEEPTAVPTVPPTEAPQETMEPTQASTEPLTGKPLSQRRGSLGRAKN